MNSLQENYDPRQDAEYWASRDAEKAERARQDAMYDAALQADRDKQDKRDTRTLDFLL